MTAKLNLPTSQILVARSADDRPATTLQLRQQRVFDAHVDEWTTAFGEITSLSASRCVGESKSIRVRVTVDLYSALS